MLKLLRQNVFKGGNLFKRFCYKSMKMSFISPLFLKSTQRVWLFPFQPVHWTATMAEMVLVRAALPTHTRRPMPVPQCSSVSVTKGSQACLEESVYVSYPQWLPLPFNGAFPWFNAKETWLMRSQWGYVIYLSCGQCYGYFSGTCSYVSSHCYSFDGQLHVDYAYRYQFSN